VELLKEYTAQLQITFMARRGSSGMRADSVNAKVVGSCPSRSDNVIKETGVLQTYSIAFSRFSNFHRKFSNFPIAFCNVFSKINLINNNNNLRITNTAKTFNIIKLFSHQFLYTDLTHHFSVIH
jgi:hypothetical protein